MTRLRYQGIMAWDHRTQSFEVVGHTRLQQLWVRDFSDGIAIITPYGDSYTSQDLAELIADLFNDSDFSKELADKFDSSNDLHTVKLTHNNQELTITRDNATVSQILAKFQKQE